RRRPSSTLFPYTTLFRSEYRKRRDKAKGLGLLWGAYHYSSGVSVSDQVANFVEQAEPDENDVIALDWEPSTDGPDMTLDQACRLDRKSTRLNSSHDQISY